MVPGALEGVLWEGSTVHNNSQSSRRPAICNSWSPLQHTATLHDKEKGHLRSKAAISTKKAKRTRILLHDYPTQGLSG